MIFRTLLAATLLCSAAAFSLVVKEDRTVSAADAIEQKNQPAHVSTAKDVMLAIHGGAGVRERARMTPDMEKNFRADLDRALQAGKTVLELRGGSLDAVEAAIKVLEDSPLFNAGKGAVFTSDGTNKLDASIMDGKDKRAGAVAGVSTIKNPICAARMVMEKSEHVLMAGRGAEIFASGHGAEIVDPTYFWTLPRWQQFQEAQKQEKEKASRGALLPRNAAGSYLGTVGAVAVDRHGNLAAGTSTGGLVNVRYGRVGDSPIIGAGTYADNQSCAISGTGHGEVFIRFAVAHDVAALVKYRQLSVPEAARTVIDGLPFEADGVGGVIALDRHGNCGLVFNTEGMYRGYVTKDGKRHVEIYKR